MVNKWNNGRYTYKPKLFKKLESAIITYCIVLYVGSKLKKLDRNGPKTKQKQEIANQNEPKIDRSANK